MWNKPIDIEVNAADIHRDPNKIWALSIAGMIAVTDDVLDFLSKFIPDCKKSNETVVYAELACSGVSLFILVVIGFIELVNRIMIHKDVRKPKDYQFHYWFCLLTLSNVLALIGAALLTQEDLCNDLGEVEYAAGALISLSKVIFPVLGCLFFDKEDTVVDAVTYQKVSFTPFG